MADFVYALDFHSYQLGLHGLLHDHEHDACRSMEGARSSNVVCHVGGDDGRHDASYGDACDYVGRPSESTTTVAP